MGQQEQYKKRRAGINAAENAGAYAVTYWTVNDIHSIKGRIPLTDEEAERILERIQGRLEDAMRERGWSVVSDGLNDFVEERKKEES